MTIQRLYATLALAAAALLVAGCGGGIRKLQNLILPGILTATMGLVLAGCSSGSDDNGGGSPPRADTEVPAPPGGGGTADPEDDDGTTLPVSDMLGVAGVTFTIERPTASAADITAMKGTMAYGESDTVARAIAAWPGEAFGDDAATETARVAIYTDIDTAADVVFHVAKGIESGAPYTLMSEDASVVTSTDSDFPDGAGNSFTWFDNPETADTDEREFEGSLMGVDGTFKCMSNPCTASRNAEDELMLSSGWTFTPTDPTSTIPVGDKDFLAFGYWNKVTADGPKDIMPFAYGSMPWAGDIEELSGSARYPGNAAGGYSHRTFDPATGKANDPTYGHFTATAILNAYFGGEEGSSIFGSVSGFTDTERTPNDLGWNLELMRTDLTEWRFSGTTTGDGMWNGAFYGPGDAMPTGAAGTFDGAFNNGTVKGAFGAKR
jgi:hypothetical protein